MRKEKKKRSDGDFQEFPPMKHYKPVISDASGCILPLIVVAFIVLGGAIFLWFE